MRTGYFYLLVSVLLLINSGCSSDDDNVIESQQFINANVNGVEFQSDEKVAPLGFKRILMPSGRINLYSKAFSANGYQMEIMIENYTGPGKYYIGDNFYNKSWLKFENAGRTESWSLEPGGALNMTTNYIEITSFQDNYIQGKIACREMMNKLDGVLGHMDGEFRLIYLE
ncbi:hypothetical protein C8P64_1431 [Christiangramia gaetbulicola]|uniref:Uncharacterized protein n=1 Tax=Christiangramia gaetbulicola TaxID=703340 RepID=A0A2T6AGE6_9FLAO|nr:hypothetical protein [Christiangramia gaetbulicola]PTX42908.1 hypothetical protein C8P64_1431 [Christiangramia gaetbulicola]